ncbi:MAG: ABC transporter ATP-binding protein [Firmicutes bacterium]|nr:ABC transporter ATP-binding protein [Bacillota bacterium]
MKLLVKDVIKSFATGDRVVDTLDNVNLKVEKGEFVTIVGPSGCGKSTLLSIIAGLEKPTDGKIYVDGREVAGPGPDRLVMFQESALFPWLNVLQNVEFGLKVSGVDKRSRREIARHYLKMVYLSRFESAYIHQLSGGMKQRVALARALALNPDILLMDEPFAALDSQTRSLLHAELETIWEETGKTIVFVTHNVEEAVTLADRVITFSARPGRIKKEFHIQLPRPRNIETPDLGRAINRVMEELKTEVEKVVKEELDSDWAVEESALLYSNNCRMGSGL